MGSVVQMRILQLNLFHLTISYACCVSTFSFQQNINPLTIENNGVSTWNFVGLLTGPTGEVGSLYLTEMSVQTTAALTVCTINLAQCNNLVPATSTLNECVCTGEAVNGGNTVYTFYVKKTADLALSGETLDLYLEVYDIFSNLPAKLSTGIYPTVYDTVAVTIEVSGNTKVLSSGNNNVTYSGQTATTDIKICAQNVANGVFEITVNNTGVATATLTNNCVERSVDASSQVVFKYTETGGLSRTDNFTIILQDTTPETTPATTPATTPVVTPDTTPETTPATTPATTPVVTPDTIQESGNIFLGIIGGIMTALIVAMIVITRKTSRENTQTTETNLEQTVLTLVDVPNEGHRPQKETVNMAVSEPIQSIRSQSEEPERESNGTEIDSFKGKSSSHISQPYSEKRLQVQNIEKQSPGHETASQTIKKHNKDSEHSSDNLKTSDESRTKKHKPGKGKHKSQEAASQNSGTHMKDSEH